MNFSSQLFVVNNKPVMLTSSLDLSNICSCDKTVVWAQPALKKTLTYYFQNDGGIKLSFSGVLAQCGSRGRNAVNTSVMDPGTWGREKIIMFHTRDPVRLPGPGLFVICYQDTIFLQFGSNKTKEDIPPVLNDPNVITSVLFWGLDSQHVIHWGNRAGTQHREHNRYNMEYKSWAPGKIWQYLVKSFRFPFSNKILLAGLILFQSLCIEP